VALVGGSGAGKSTFVNLLPRFYDVNDGRITVDGRDVRDVKLESLRALMGFVTQEVVLFNDTVKNNIAYGRTDVDDERVADAARAANAHEFISMLPNGYDTMIGESGVLLSGGQRQRLAIARALFKDPPILILDEATSALDTESERLVQQALNNLMQGRTTLVIAHRLSTIRSADKIVVLDKGQIAEVGPHEELLAVAASIASCTICNLPTTPSGRSDCVRFVAWMGSIFIRAARPLRVRIHARTSNHSRDIGLLAPTCC
jgi:subfamily B ATP-binding cassette protein MsbA